MNTSLEYESAKLLHSFSPHGLPALLLFDTYTSDPDSHFYLCAFLDMRIRIPDTAKFCALLAELHENSVAILLRANTASMSPPTRATCHRITHGPRSGKITMFAA